MAFRQRPGAQPRSAAAGPGGGMSPTAAAPVSLRRRLTSSTLTLGAWLPQLVRMKLTTSAISWSFIRQPNGGMVKLDGAWWVAGRVPPLSTMCTREVGSLPVTTGLPARAGKTRA